MKTSDERTLTMIYDFLDWLVEHWAAAATVLGALGAAAVLLAVLA
jgi:hypothetical protein